MRIALYQCQACTADVARNLERLHAAALSAAATGAQLLLCPEMMLTGYNLGRARIQTLAEPRDGPGAARVAAIAAAAGIAIAYGYPERADGDVFNAARLVDRHGAPCLDYRKTHLFGAAERAVFSAGDTVGMTATVDGWQVSLLICYDVEFPESVRLCALAGAELVLVPTALMQPYERLPAVLMPARAHENQLYVAYANYCGQEGDLDYCGNSVIAAPDGRCLGTAAQDEILLFAEIDRASLDASRRLNTYLADRRPALYGELVAPAPSA